VTPRLLVNVLTFLRGMKVDNQPSLILLYHMWSGVTTRPSKYHILKRPFTLSDITRYSDYLQTEGFDSQWETGGEYFLGLKADVTWNWPLHLVPQLSMSGVIPPRRCQQHRTKNFERRDQWIINPKGCTSLVFVWSAKKHEKRQSEEAVSGPRFEAGSPEYKARVLPSGWRRSEF
jgi:hypothetical protein